MLYVGQLWEGSTTLDRMRALEELGHDVAAFDTSPYDPRGPRLFASPQFRLLIGPWVRRLNKDLLAFAGARGGQFDAVWFDKARAIVPGTIQALRGMSRGPLVHFTPDAAFLVHGSRHFRRAVVLYDALVTTKLFEVTLHERFGARRVMVTQQSYEPSRCHPGAPIDSYASDVAFVGHRERHYERVLATVAALNVDLAVWGPGWTRRAPRTVRPHVRGGFIYGAAYGHALRSAKIALGLLSKRIPETSTTRTFEIPACRTMMLAERTPEHQTYFEEGREAEFFESSEELAEKIRFYLSNDAARERIAAAGRVRCERSGYGTPAIIRGLAAELLQ